MRPWEYDHAVGRGWSNLDEHRSGAISGIFTSKYGYVRIFQSEYMHENKQQSFACFQFIWGGREYTRTIRKRRYTKIGLARMASAYAKEIVKRHTQPLGSNNRTEIRI